VAFVVGGSGASEIRAEPLNKGTPHGIQFFINISFSILLKEPISCSLTFAVDMGCRIDDTRDGLSQERSRRGASLIPSSEISVRSLEY
jgi:hypothetical protein